jgi:AcrR family transcriptional regulator
MSEINKDEATREGILQAAKRVFQKWGLNKTTMEDIAREAGKGKSTLYYYYQSKEQIFDTVVKIEIGALLARAKASVHEIRGAKEKMRKYVAASITEMNDTVALYEILRTEIREDPHFLEKVREQFEREEVQFLQDILTLGVQQNHFSFANDHELETSARVVLGMIRALELSLLLGNYDSKHIDRAARLIANGI